MMIRILGFAIVLSWPLAVSAQTAPLPPVESVVVTGTKSPHAMEDFVGEVGQPTRLIGKLARWEVPVCVRVTGVNASATTFLANRVQEVAAGAGARINRDSSCRPNVQIVFTTTPQALVSDIRKHQADRLGYFDTIAQLDSRAVFHGPIQAFYMTGTRDARGNLQIDTGRTEGIVIDGGPNRPDVWLTHARAYAVTGSRLGDGLRANLHHVTIIADPTKLLDHQMGPVADYLSMMALSQMQSLDRCQPLPSITNLMVAGCARVPAGLSDIDLGYLRGLYHMDVERNRAVQLHQIVYDMRREVLKDE